ncbi:MAG: hypothetical protein P8M16_05115 [Acidimicrobiales bacterium]|nr:hypothetical protein [Acidimicrobiales bacterium]
MTLHILGTPDQPSWLVQQEHPVGMSGLDGVVRCAADGPATGPEPDDPIFAAASAIEPCAAP